MGCPGLPACAPQGAQKGRTNRAYADAVSEPPPEIDFEAEGLLDGLEGRQREERLALLQQLAADGVPLSELRRTTDSRTVMFLPADRLIVSDRRYTAKQVSEITGIEPEMLNSLSRSMGLPIADPDDPV